MPTPPGLLLAPFRALRFDADGPALARRLSPPYDVIDEAERSALESRDPHNVVRVILPRDTEEEGSRYRQAGRLLAQWRAQGVLRPDDEPALYVYEETTADGHVQRGLLGAVGLAAPDAGIILPHENTMAGPVADRLSLTTATGTHLEPILLVYQGGGAASEAVASVEDGAPLVSTQTDDGIRHRLWSLTDPDRLAAVAADLLPRRAVIADGHHRYATFLRYQQQRHDQGEGTGPWDFGLAYLVDATRFGPEVHPIHRVVPSLSWARAVELAAEGFRVEVVEADLDAALARLGEATGTAFLLTDGQRHALLTAPDAKRLAAAVDQGRSTAWQRLDVTVAHALLVRELWGLADHEDVVGYRHDVAAAVAAARAADGTALLLNPTPVEAVTDVAAAGERMPRKSTLFTPKPRTGLVLRPLDDGS